MSVAAREAASDNVWWRYMLPTLTLVSALWSTCYSEQTNFERNCDLLQRTGQVTEVDHRETLSAYAQRKGLSVSSVEEAFRATGFLSCAGLTSTAQLTGRSDVLTAAAHSFFGPYCTPVTPRSCFFVLEDELFAPRYYVDSVVSPGCPQIAKDWAVVKLQTSVPRVRPYDYPRTDPMLQVDKPVTQVSARADNFMVGDKYPKTVERCYLRVINPRSWFPVLTDCNTGPGSSGAAQLIEDDKGKTVVGAIHVADSVGGKSKSGFDAHTLFSISIPLAGDFLQALREALK
jgi:hypothetical protein